MLTNNKNDCKGNNFCVCEMFRHVCREKFVGKVVEIWRKTTTSWNNYSRHTTPIVWTKWFLLTLNNFLHYSNRRCRFIGCVFHKWTMKMPFLTITWVVVGWVVGWLLGELLGGCWVTVGWLLGGCWVITENSPFFVFEKRAILKGQL